MTVQLNAASAVVGFDLAFVSISAGVNITATSSATGTLALDTGKFNVVNGGNYYVEFWSPRLTIGTTNLDLEVWDGGTSGTFLSTLTGHMTATTPIGQGVGLEVRVNLTAGAHQITVNGFVDGGTGVVGAGSGATGQLPNAFVRVRSA
jgi:hypothetical protein